MSSTSQDNLHHLFEHDDPLLDGLLVTLGGPAGATPETSAADILAAAQAPAHRPATSWRAAAAVLLSASLSAWGGMTAWMGTDLPPPTAASTLTLPAAQEQGPWAPPTTPATAVPPARQTVAVEPEVLAAQPPEPVDDTAPDRVLADSVDTAPAPAHTPATTLSIGGGLQTASEGTPVGMVRASLAHRLQPRPSSPLLGATAALTSGSLVAAHDAKSPLDAIVPEATMRAGWSWRGPHLRLDTGWGLGLRGKRAHRRALDPITGPFLAASATLPSGLVLTSEAGVQVDLAQTAGVPTSPRLELTVGVTLPVAARRG